MQYRAALRSARKRVATWFPARRVVKICLAVIVLGLVVGIGSDLWIRMAHRKYEYSVETAPPADVAIVFGAEVWANGKPSSYLAARLDLGRKLLEAGKVKALLLTGDNGRASYDEPTAMRAYLIDHGVPAAKIALDYAGFSTYESCVRAHDIFGVTSAIAVTQDFSLPRTIALCRAAGIDATAVGDDTQVHGDVYRKNWLREQLADTKAVYSILFRPEPTFRGRQESSVRDAMAADPQQ
ncbi:SanA/YdcF family protein [Nocardia concava]|uniref:SanA/YdcF family protein n=1 Tax=Nocardia concava TaxID=257281 RepID=UPI00030BA2CE|nr:ElyC/SanA/YdcF family protein [Nocardia concava]